MTTDEKKHIESLAKKYGVAPHQLMDALKIKYSKNNYHVNNKVFSSYYEAVIEAECSKEEIHIPDALSQSSMNQIDMKNKKALRVIYNIHFLMSVIYALGAIALFIFLLSIWSNETPTKLVAIDTISFILAGLHFSALILWKDGNPLAVRLSIFAGITLLPGFPFGTVFGFALVYYALNYIDVRNMPSGYKYEI